ncbi:hypothetical protein GA0070558_11237 [Micromonospora haikouensis]|uniref:Uncharacterized protein n=1 Tax=Micromonospora haikouensis TaxID=686309 RepID=A0A1C4VYX2_9ACTN|nr:hypothetical protein GA0070558_11237 [Micromonospora haikouensis]
MRNGFPKVNGCRGEFCPGRPSGTRAGGIFGRGACDGAHAPATADPSDLRRSGPP